MQPYPRGTPRRLTNDLIDYRSSATAADGKSIVSVGLDANPVLWTIPLDGKGEPRKLPSLRYDGTFGVSWGVDGQIMFTSPVRGALQIWTMNLDGSNRRAITTEGTSAWPSLSRDGRFVAFSGVRGEQRGVWRMNPDGSDQRLVAAVPNATFLDTTPDSQWITFTTDQDGAPSLWRVASTGGTPERLVDRLERGALSPAGDRVFGVFAQTPRYEGAVLPLAGGEPMWIPSDGSAATGGNGIYAWAPDGKGVYFTTAERMNLFSYRFGAPAQTNVTKFNDAHHPQRRDLARRPHDARVARRAGEGCVPDHEFPLRIHSLRSAVSYLKSSLVGVCTAILAVVVWVVASVSIDTGSGAGSATVVLDTGLLTLVAVAGFIVGFVLHWRASRRSS